MQRKTVVLFDLDGTVWSSTVQSYEQMLIELAALGVVITDGLKRDLLRQWGMHFAPLKQAHFPHIPDDEMYKLYKRVDGKISIAPFLAAEAVIRLLRERGLGVYSPTSRARTSAVGLLTKFGMIDHFNRIVSAHEIGWGNAKPSPYSINVLIDPLEKALGLRREDVVFVGDALIADRECAENAGVEFVATCEEGLVTRQMWRDEGVADDHIIGSIAELPHWLRIE